MTHESHQVLTRYSDIAWYGVMIIDRLGLQYLYLYTTMCVARRLDMRALHEMKPLVNCLCHTEDGRWKIEHRYPFGEAALGIVVIRTAARPNSTSGRHYEYYDLNRHQLQDGPRARR